MWLAVPPLFLLVFPPCPVPAADSALCWTNLFCYKVSDWLVTCDWPYLLYSYWCFLPVMFQQLTQRSVGPTYFVTRYLIGYLYEAMWLALPPLFLLVFPPCHVPTADWVLYYYNELFCYEESDWLLIWSDVIGRTSSIPIGVSSLSCSSSRLSALLDWIILLRGIWLVSYTKWCDWPYLLYSYWCFLPVLFQQTTQRSVGLDYFVTRYLIGYFYLPPLFL